ncbi:HNH endonuclease signature motif containing protein [Ruania zhangjianzhongii]|uniref:HNH endonuclease signature motif containing protein n=1 Tax=Ruania zhangjianzhongii TaxID=2603206 RepID=UPI00143D186B|nr:HNH endonuclease signature motif containing protein [Ruania zhangjianzhongii]
MTANADDRNTPAGKRPAGDDLSERPVWQLAAELGSLAAGIAASTCRFLVLLGEFDARDGWGHYAGVTSSTHWLSWQCGMAAVTAREQVRVARAMRSLPLTCAEFGAGRLSYSKVRAITRVATPENEAELVQVAEAGTADQVQRFCAGVRTAAGSLAEVNERHDRAAVTYRTLDDGSVSVSVRCSPEQGAVIVDRLHEAREYLKRTAADQDESGYSLLDALVLVCEQSEIEAGASRTRGSRRAETVLHTTLADLAGTPVTANQGPPALIGPRLESGAALHPETARRLACDSGLVTHLHEDGSAPPGDWVRPNPRPGRTVDLGRRRRLPSAALFRAMWDRDHGCVYPGCGRRQYLHGHHLVHWVRGGRTDLDNMVLLCGEHHRRLHEGGYQMRRGPGGPIVVLTPDGSPVSQPSSTANGPVVPAAEDASLVALDGGRLHLAYAVSTVVTNWARRRQLAAEQDGHAA